MAVLVKVSISDVGKRKLRETVVRRISQMKASPPVIWTVRTLSPAARLGQGWMTRPAALPSVHAEMPSKLVSAFARNPPK